MPDARYSASRLNVHSERGVATYVFAGGGTGGHLYPGVAVAREILRREPEARIVFVGSDRPIERQILAAEEFEHRVLPVESFRTARRNPLRFLQQNWSALRQARRWLKELRPQAVVGLGSFVSVPTVLAASQLGVPITLLEQNTRPGRANRWLSRRADVICVPSVEAASVFAPHRCVLIAGNPVRPEIAALHARQSHDPVKRCLLILGGSQGADSLNAVVLQAVTTLKEELRDWTILHQTGPRQTDAVRQSYAELDLSAVVEPFFSDLPERYRAANLVISRAGATTLAELACAGCPAILVPYPQAAEQHQRENALIFVNASAALMVEEASDSDSTGAMLAEALRRLLPDAARRAAMRIAMYALARPAAAARIAELLIARCSADAA